MKMITNRKRQKFKKKYYKFQISINIPNKISQQEIQKIII